MITRLSTPLPLVAWRINLSNSIALPLRKRRAGYGQRAGQYRAGGFADNGGEPCQADAMTDHPDYEAFRAEITAFAQEQCPPPIRALVAANVRLGLELLSQWHHILYARGWGAPNCIGRAFNPDLAKPEPIEI